MRLKVDNLCGPGVDNVTFTLRQGEILGVAGLMGRADRTDESAVRRAAAQQRFRDARWPRVVTRSPQDGLANGIVYLRRP